ncbi:luciferase domain-containing protein [Nocardia sp. Marseille-Q1738]
MTLPSLPYRFGARPETGPAVPHVQLSQLSPPALREQLRDWLTALPGTVTGPSEISDPAKMRRWMAATFPDKPIPHDIPDENALAIFLDGARPQHGVVLMPPSLTTEVAHIHPDGSLHLAMSLPDQEELLAKGWGERHPLYSAKVNVVMLFGPRDADELRVAQVVVEAAYRYAVGEDISTVSP